MKVGEQCAARCYGDVQPVGNFTCFVAGSMMMGLSVCDTREALGLTSDQRLSDEKHEILAGTMRMTFETTGLSTATNEPPTNSELRAYFTTGIALALNISEANVLEVVVTPVELSDDRRLTDFDDDALVPIPDLGGNRRLLDLDQASSHAPSGRALQAGVISVYDVHYEAVVFKEDLIPNLLGEAKTLTISGRPRNVVLVDYVEEQLRGSLGVVSKIKDTVTPFVFQNELLVVKEEDSVKEVVGRMPFRPDPNPPGLPPIVDTQALPTEETADTAMVLASVLGGFLVLGVLGVVGMRSMKFVKNKENEKDKKIDEAFNEMNEEKPVPGVVRQEPAEEPAPEGGEFAINIEDDFIPDDEETVEQWDARPTAGAMGSGGEDPRAPRAAEWAERSRSKELDGESWEIPDDDGQDFILEQPTGGVGRLHDLVTRDASLAFAPEPLASSEKSLRDLMIASPRISPRTEGSARSSPRALPIEMTALPEEPNGSTGNLRGLLTVDNRTAAAASTIPTAPRSSQGTLRALLTVSAPSTPADVNERIIAFNSSPRSQDSQGRRWELDASMPAWDADASMPTWDGPDSDFALELPTPRQGSRDSPILAECTATPCVGAEEPDELWSPSMEELPESPHANPLTLQTWMAMGDPGLPSLPEDFQTSGGNLRDLMTAANTEVSPGQATTGVVQPNSGLPTLREYLVAGNSSPKGQLSLEDGELRFQDGMRSLSDQPNDMPTFYEDNPSTWEMGPRGAAEGTPVHRDTYDPELGIPEWDSPTGLPPTAPREPATQQEAAPSPSNSALRQQAYSSAGAEVMPSSQMFLRHQGAAVGGAPSAPGGARENLPQVAPVASAELMPSTPMGLRQPPQNASHDVMPSAQMGLRQPAAPASSEVMPSARMELRPRVQPAVGADRPDVMPSTQMGLRQPARPGLPAQALSEERTDAISSITMEMRQPNPASSTVMPDSQRTGRQPAAAAEAQTWNGLGGFMSWAGLAGSARQEEEPPVYTGGSAPMDFV